MPDTGPRVILYSVYTVLLTLRVFSIKIVDFECSTNIYMVYCTSGLHRLVSSDCESVILPTEYWQARKIYMSKSGP